MKDKLIPIREGIDEKLTKLDFKTLARIEVKLEKTIIEKKKCDKAKKELEEKVKNCNSESNGSSSMDNSEASTLIAMFILVKFSYIF